MNGQNAASPARHQRYQDPRSKFPLRLLLFAVAIGCFVNRSNLAAEEGLRQVLAPKSVVVPGTLLHFELDGRAESFSATVGVQDSPDTRRRVTFRIYGDGKKLYDSDSLQSGEPAKACHVPLTGVSQLVLAADSDGAVAEETQAHWGKAKFAVRGEDPQLVPAPRLDPAKVILTPQPGDAPRINGPRLAGARPGHPFIYRIPCTGARPLSFSVGALPAGLTVDSRTGIIAGRTPRRTGSYPISFQASNTTGSTTKAFTLVVGDQLALTPPMGWNSWYIHYQRVTDRVMREAADAMVESGMANFGYQYVNIDDCWMQIEPGYFDSHKQRLADIDPDRVIGRLRDEQGRVLPNDDFPDMNAMTDYIHARGLRAGIYTSPGPRTCQRYAGSYGHEQQDAEQYAAWGFDFLKYDWCSYGEIYQKRMQGGGDDLAEKMRPYQQMGQILQGLDRDIVLNLCQYGMNEVWKWGGEVGGHCWRTTGDLGLHRGSDLPGFYHIGLNNARHWEYAGPGRWNDPDYILIGWVGSAHQHGVGTETTLTGNEQYSYLSLWSLMAAPLVFSGDMAKLDAFTLNVLCNHEVIDINQDALGKQARLIAQNNECAILAKPMEDGSLAVGLFNLRSFPIELALDWKQLGLEGPQRVRDAWRQRDLGVLKGTQSFPVAGHGVLLTRIWPTAN